MIARPFQPSAKDGDMSNPRFTLAELRTQLMELAESITGYAPPPKPDRFERDNQNKIGPEWHVPQSPRRNGWDPRLVRVVEGESGVFVEGAPTCGAAIWKP
jgi:hypothetical protein